MKKLAFESRRGIFQERVIDPCFLIYIVHLQRGFSGLPSRSYHNAISVFLVTDSDLVSTDIPLGMSQCAYTLAESPHTHLSPDLRATISR